MQRPWSAQWPKGVPQSINYPNHSLDQVFRLSVKEAGNSNAIFFRNVALTYGELDKLVNSFGSALQKMGVRKGDRVAIYLPNTPQFVIAYYGILRVGGVVVTCSPLYKEREVTHILNDSGAETLILLDKLASNVQLAEEKTRLKNLITTTIDDLHGTQANNLADCPSKIFSNAHSRFRNLITNQSTPKVPDIDPQKDIALLQYTGGTTGTPKGAMLTHRNLVVNAVQFATWLYMRNKNEAHLAVLPLFHIYGMTAAMNAPIYTSSSMILIPDPRDTSSIFEAIDRYKPTILCGVPATYVALINNPNFERHRINSIRICISGAAPLPSQVQHRFEELTGARLVEGYGLTEASPVTHINPLDEPGKNKPGSIGIPISDTECKIVDLQLGEKTLSALEVGELMIKGPQVMKGYWNMPDETDQVLKNGWLLTGDIAVMDHDGYFRIVDRKKDMINVSGFKVYPHEVEEVLCEHPAIKEAAVVAYVDQDGVEGVKAFVVLNSDHTGRTSPFDIIAFCSRKLANYKVPSMVEFTDSFPKSPVGKTLRKNLRRQTVS